MKTIHAAYIGLRTTANNPAVANLSELYATVAARPAARPGPRPAFTRMERHDMTSGMGAVRTGLVRLCTEWSFI